MDLKDIERKVILAIRSTLGKYGEDVEIDLGTLLFQTGLDFSSLDAVMLIVKIEEIFDIKWPDEKLNFNDTFAVREVVEIVSEILKNEG